MRKPSLLIALYISLFYILVGCSKDELEIKDDSFENEPFVTMEPSTDSLNEPKITEQSPETKWLLSSQTSSGLIASTENSDFVSLYDNALSALVFIETNNLDQAEAIFDYFDNSRESEFNIGNGGFYQFRNTEGTNLSRKWMGDNAWLLIALNKYHQTTNSFKYESMANQIEGYLRNLQDVDGGLWGGEEENGAPIPKVTEGIITAFNAVKGYDDFHKGILSFLKNERWDTKEEILVAWPENPTYNNALDLHSLGSLIFSEISTESLSNANRFYTTQIATVNGKEVSGYCFDEDNDVVWLEGTAQMAVAYLAKNDYDSAQLIINELDKTLLKSSTTQNTLGLPYTANHGTSFGSSALWDHSDLTPAVSTTAWYIFSKLEINPLKQGIKNEIPAADRFWMNN